jgi:hypothetical protein
VIPPDSPFAQFAQEWAEEEQEEDEPLGRVRGSKWRASPNTPSLKHHERKCCICRHPDREAIEDDFMNWDSPHEIYKGYDLPSRSAVYRHAHASGLFPLRKRNLRFVLERVLDQVNTVDITAMSIVHAVKLYARITDDGTLLGPPKAASSGAPQDHSKPSKMRATAHGSKLRSAKPPRRHKMRNSNRDKIIRNRLKSRAAR